MVVQNGRETSEPQPVKAWLRGAERARVSELETIGDHEIVKLPVDAYLPLNQVRGGSNPILEELKDSILERDLSQPGSVARMTPDMLQEYLEFVRDVWGSTTTIDQLDSYLQSDGFYYVIITGHTRHQAILELRNEGKLRPDVKLACMVRQVASVGEILQIQLDENGIRSNPPMERSAVAIVEHYEYGRRVGLWADPDSYCKANKKLTGRMVQDALLFANLPEDIRGLIYTKYISYAGGVELAKAAPILRQYVLTQIDRNEADLSAEEIVALDTVAHDKMMNTVHQIKQSRLNGPASVKKIKGWVASLVASMPVEADATDADGKKAAKETMFDLFSSDAQLRDMLKAAQQELTSTLTAYQHLTADTAVALIERGSGSLSSNTKRKIVADLAAAAQHATYIAETLI